MRMLFFLHMVYIRTVEPVFKDHTFSNENTVSQDRLALVTVSFALKCGTFCQEYMHGPSRQVVSHGSGLSRQVSMYLYPYNMYKLYCHDPYKYGTVPKDRP